MAKGVHTRMKRFEFVKGWLTGGTDPADGSVECGDYTDFPVEVTGATNADKLDKIAEIYYRAKYAQFTSNDLIDNFSNVYSGVSSGSVTPRIQYESGSFNGDFLMNGYWTLDTESAPCNADSIPYLTAIYSGTYNDPYGWGGGIDTITADFRDILNNERGIWLPEQLGYQPIWNRMMPDLVGLGTFYVGVDEAAGADQQGFRTAFSWYSSSASGSSTVPNLAIPYIYEEFTFDGVTENVYENLEVLVEFSGTVAIIKNNPNNSDFASDNRYFLGLRFRAKMVFAEVTSGTGFIESTARYIMRLSSGDLSCPLGSAITEPLSGDIVHEITEWFPYQDSGGNVWSPTTGAKL